MQEKNNIKALTYATILLSASIILGYVEAVFPINIGQIGIKIGLSNIISILGIKTLGVKKTFLINILRLIILGVYFGNLVRFIISLTGFLLSFIVMAFMLKMLRFSINVSSIFGGVFHNIGQFIALVFILGNDKILYLMPLYIILGIVSGLIVGIISTITYNKLQKIKFE